MELAQRKTPKASADGMPRQRHEKSRDLEVSTSRVELAGGQLPGASPRSESGASSSRNESEPRPERRAFKFDRLPITEKDASGRLVKELAIDYWAYAGSTLLISGWVMGDDIKQLCPSRAAYAPRIVVSFFRRPDVENAYPTFTAGILAVITLDGAEDFSLFGFKLKFPSRDDNDGSFAAFLTEHTQRFGFLLESLPEG
jgi:hypothetical protein